MKAPSSVSTMVTSSHVFYQGMYYQVGDIVSVMDEEHGIYYAQIRGLLQDQYCEKSAVLTWLIPTQNSPPPEKEFDPHTYILGTQLFTDFTGFFVKSWKVAQCWLVAVWCFFFSKMKTDFFLPLLLCKDA